MSDAGGLGSSARSARTDLYRALHSLTDIAALREKQQYDHWLRCVWSHLWSGELYDETRKTAEHYFLDDRDLLSYAADGTTKPTLAILLTLVP